MVIYAILGFVAAALVMVKAGDYAVKALSAIGKNLNIGHFVVSFFLVGIVSTFPEAFVSIVAAVDKLPNLGFGVLIGSAIADLSFILGMVAILAGSTKIENGLTYEVWLFALLSLPILLALDGTIGRVDGIILILSCFLFFFTLFKKNHVVDQLMHSDKKHLVKHVFVFLVSGVVIFISANYVVKYAQIIAVAIGVPLVVIGLVMIALATSLPEFILAVNAARHKLGDVAIGEIFGVIVIDATLLMGIVAIINPITIPYAELVNIGIFLLTTLSLATYFLQSGKVITWREGILLVFFYMLFIAAQMSALGIRVALLP